MIVLSIILIIVGFVFGLPLLWEIGLAILLIGLVLNFVPIGGYRGPIRGRWY